MQRQIVSFGEKESFSIELGCSKSSNKCLLRFWIQNQPMGTFKKASTLDFSIKTYTSILQKKNTMHLPAFENMTAKEINDYTRGNPNKNDFALKLEQLVPLYKLAFFGPQFTDTQSEYLILYEEGTFRFIWKNDYNEPLCEAFVSLIEFRKVFDQYIEYCYEHTLVKV